MSLYTREVCHPIHQGGMPPYTLPGYIPPYVHPGYTSLCYCTLPYMRLATMLHLVHREEALGSERGKSLGNGEERRTLRRVCPR